VKATNNTALTSNWQAIGTYSVHYLLKGVKTSNDTMMYQYVVEAQAV
jgi:hypothetical protein